MAGTLLLEGETQFLCLPALLVKLGLKLSELCQLSLLLRCIGWGWRHWHCGCICRSRRGRRCVCSIIVVTVLFPQVGNKALLRRVVVPFAGVVGAGEAVVCCRLKRQKGSEVADPGVVPLRIHAGPRGGWFLVRGVEV